MGSGFYGELANMQAKSIVFFQRFDEADCRAKAEHVLTFLTGFGRKRRARSRFEQERSRAFRD
jgi:hypothetical protein